MNTRTDKNLENACKILKAISNPVRMCIVKGLMDQETCTVGKMQKCLKTSQANISQHLYKLKMAGVVSSKQKGNFVHYSLCSDEVREIIKVLFKEK